MIKKWEADGQRFIDTTGLTDEGQLFDPMGLVGLLLILVAMRSEAQVISDEDRKKIAEIADITVPKTALWAKDGFLPTPWVNAEAAKELFDRTTAYVDSITWTMSACILIRYAAHNKLAFSPPTPVKPPTPN